MPQLPNVFETRRPTQLILPTTPNLLTASSAVFGALMMTHLWTSGRLLLILTARVRVWSLSWDCYQAGVRAGQVESSLQCTWAAARCYTQSQQMIPATMVCLQGNSDKRGETLLVHWTYPTNFSLIITVNQTYILKYTVSKLPQEAKHKKISTWSYEWNSSHVLFVSWSIKEFLKTVVDLLQFVATHHTCMIRLTSSKVYFIVANFEAEGLE